MRAVPTAYGIAYIRTITRRYVGSYPIWEKAIQLMDDYFDDPSVSPNARTA